MHEGPASGGPLKAVIILGFALGVLGGMAGSAVPAGPGQQMLWEISSVGLIVAALTLASVLRRRGHDVQATGFTVLALAEAVMSSGTLGGVTGPFAAGVALYTPALLLIGLPKSSLALWARAVTCIAALPFAAAAVLLYAGQSVPPTSMLPGIGYALLSLATLGWLLRTVKGDLHAAEAAASTA